MFSRMSRILMARGWALRVESITQIAWRNSWIAGVVPSAMKAGKSSKRALAVVRGLKASADIARMF